MTITLPVVTVTRVALSTSHFGTQVTKVISKREGEISVDAALESLSPHSHVCCWSNGWSLLPSFDNVDIGTGIISSQRHRYDNSTSYRSKWHTIPHVHLSCNRRVHDRQTLNRSVLNTNQRWPVQYKNQQTGYCSKHRFIEEITKTHHKSPNFQPDLRIWDCTMTPHFQETRQPEMATDDEIIKVAHIRKYAADRPVDQISDVKQRR